MTVTILKEVTDWSECEYTQPNHTYYINEHDKLIGYKLEGTDKEIFFNKPLSFYKSRRKFIQL